jgi:hypothetical protein
MIELKEGELARLIRLSDRERWLSLSFGPRGARLIVENSPWAAELLKEWRAESDPTGL